MIALHWSAGAARFLHVTLEVVDEESGLSVFRNKQSRIAWLDEFVVPFYNKKFKQRRSGSAMHSEFVALNTAVSNKARGAALPMHRTVIDPN